jgi:hypothetical protein
MVDSTVIAVGSTIRGHSGQSSFNELPDVMVRLVAGSLSAICHHARQGLDADLLVSPR